jgi:hypothetical protein
MSSALLSTILPVSHQTSIKVLNASDPAKDARHVTLTFVSPMETMVCPMQLRMDAIPRAAYFYY